MARSSNVQIGPFRVPAAMSEGLEEVAADRGVPLAQVVREAVAEYLERHSPRSAVNQELHAIGDEIKAQVARSIADYFLGKRGDPSDR